MSDVLSIGTKTQWGEIYAVGWVGERYYWMHDDEQGGCVSMIPARIVEESLNLTNEAP